MSPRKASPELFWRPRLTLRQMMARWMAVAVGGAVLLLLLPLGWVLFSSLQPQPLAGGENQSPPVAAPRPISVSTTQVGYAGPGSLSQTFTGIIQPRRASVLAAKDIGRVDKIMVEMGEQVAAGQLLVQLDHATLDADRRITEARWSAAKARLEELQRGPRQQEIDQAVARVEEISAVLQLNQANFRRIEALLNSSSISRQQLDQAKSSVEVTQAQLAAARQALALLREGTRPEQLAAAEATLRGLEAELRRIDVRLSEHAIHAPYAGKIQTRWIDEGVVVSPGQPILQIVESAELEVHVGLPPELAREMSLSNFAVSADGHRLSVEVARLSPAINEATRTREVVLRVAPASAEWVAPGSAVQVEVRTPAEASAASAGGAFWIPRESLTTAARGLWAVFVAVPVPGEQDRGLIERRQVELLRSQGEWVEVRGPLDANENLVIAGGHRVAPGQLVVIDSRQP